MGIMIKSVTVRLKDTYGNIVTMRCVNDRRVGRLGWTIEHVDSPYDQAMREMGHTERNREMIEKYWANEKGLTPQRREWLLEDAATADRGFPRPSGYFPFRCLMATKAFQNRMKGRGIDVEIVEREEVPTPPMPKELRDYFIVY